MAAIFQGLKQLWRHKPCSAQKRIAQPLGLILWKAYWHAKIAQFYLHRIIEISAQENVIKRQISMDNPDRIVV